LATAFHSACVSELLQHLKKNGSDAEGDCLAATCILKSYEILNGKNGTPVPVRIYAHNFDGELTKGATASSRRVLFHNQRLHNLRDCGLPQAEAWNYLREEITVVLECRRTVCIGDDFTWEGEGDLTDDMLANFMSYYLARIINFCFDAHPGHTLPEDRIMAWHALRSDLTTRRDNLPSTFNPFPTSAKAGNAFPSLWMLQPWHSKTTY
jgi:hypothetical protein